MSSRRSSATSGGNARTVAGYVLTEKLGSGSFASVYKARRYASVEKGKRVSKREAENQPSVVAVKAISKSRLRGGRLQANLESEISILEKLKHPNIVRLYGIHKSERHIYLFLEYCDMGDLHAYIRKQPNKRLDGDSVRGFLAQLAEGVRFLWSQNLIHRDLKPQNLLLSAMDSGGLPNLKIADFGFARHLATASMAETLCGSPLYMAPEILRFHKYDAKADLWSVGTIIFEMLAGKPPFHGSNPAELLKNIESMEVRVPSDVTADAACIDILQRLLRRNPLERISFHEFFSAPYVRDAPRLGVIEGDAGANVELADVDAAAAADPDTRSADCAPPKPRPADSLGAASTHAPLSSPASLPSSPSISAARGSSRDERKDVPLGASVELEQHARPRVVSGSDAKANSGSPLTSKHASSTPELKVDIDSDGHWEFVDDPDMHGPSRAAVSFADLDSKAEAAVRRYVSFAKSVASRAEIVFMVGSIYVPESMYACHRVPLPFTDPSLNAVPESELRTLLCAPEPSVSIVKGSPQAQACALALALRAHELMVEARKAIACACAVVSAAPSRGSAAERLDSLNDLHAQMDTWCKGCHACARGIRTCLSDATRIPDANILACRIAIVLARSGAALETLPESPVKSMYTSSLLLLESTFVSSHLPSCAPSTSSSKSSAMSSTRANASVPARQLAAAVRKRIAATCR